MKIDNPMTAIRYGIGMVHQHFMLAPSLTVAENMIMGMEPKRLGLIDSEKAVKMCREVAEKYNFSVNPVAKVGSLPVGVKQKVEILKALLRGAKILILDEPTNHRGSYTSGNRRIIRSAKAAKGEWPYNNFYFT